MIFAPRSRARCLFLAAAASVLVHLPAITAPPLDYHYHRQVNTAAIARNYYRNGLRFLKPQIDWEGSYSGRAATEFPLYMWLTGLLWPLGRLGDVWGRILSLLFSSLTAVYLFLLVELLLDTEKAFYASVLFSFIPLEIYFGRTIQPEALALLATVATLYHWHRHWQPRRPWSHWLLATAFAFLAVSHKIPYAYLFMPLAGLALLKGGTKSLADWRSWLAFLLACGGVLAWYRFASSGAYVVPTQAESFRKLFDYERLPFYVQFQFLSRWPELAATYGGAVLALVGMRSLGFSRPFLWVWFAAVCLYVVAGGGYTFYHEYTSLPFAAVNAAFMGAGLSFLLARRLHALALLLVLAMPVHAFFRIRHWYGTDYAFLLKAAEAADAVSAKEDLFACNNRATSLYLYFLDRKGWSWDLEEAGVERLDEVDSYARAGAKFFMTRKSGAFADPESLYFKRFKRYPLVYDQDGILIYKLTGSSASRS